MDRVIRNTSMCTFETCIYLNLALVFLAFLQMTTSDVRPSQLFMSQQNFPRTTSENFILRISSPRFLRPHAQHATEPCRILRTWWISLSERHYLSRTKWPETQRRYFLVKSGKDTDWRLMMLLCKARISTSHIHPYNGTHRFWEEHSTLPWYSVLQFIEEATGITGIACHGLGSNTNESFGSNQAFIPWACWFRYLFRGHSWLIWMILNKCLLPQ